jgi:hypothetical protein
VLTPRETVFRFARSSIAKRHPAIWPVRLAAFVETSDGDGTLARPARGLGAALEKILALSKQDVIDMWSAAPPVEFDKLDGDYIGLLPNARDSQAQAQDLQNLENGTGFLGYWYGKSFKLPGEGEAVSEGYNR